MTQHADLFPALIVGLIVAVLGSILFYRRRQPSGIPTFVDVFDELKTHIYFASSMSDVDALQDDIDNFYKAYHKQSRGVVYQFARDLNKLLEDKRTELKNQASLRSARQASFT